MRSLYSTLLLACLVLFAARGDAQWQQSMSPTDLPVWSIFKADSSLFAGIGTWGQTGGSIWISNNDGATWTRQDSLPGNAAVLGFARLGQRLFAGTSDGVFVTTDYGVHWNASGPKGVTCLLTSGMYLYAGTRGNGLFFSTDSGATWLSASTDLSNKSVTSLARGVTSGGEGRSVMYAGVYGGVLRSTDDGATWETADSGITIKDVRALVVKDTVIFAGTNGAGVFASSDEGHSWQASGTGLLPAGALVQTLFVTGSHIVAGTGTGVYASTGLGADWLPISTGIQYISVLSLATSGPYLLAGTAGEGIWRVRSDELMGPLFRSATLASSRLFSVFGNWGVIGQPIDNRPRGAWVYPTNGYIGDLSLLIGLELPVRDYNGDLRPDTVHSVITCPVSRPCVSSDTDPVTGEYFTFGPEPGYANPTNVSVALSDDPTTWPSSWPDHLEYGQHVWNGLFGANTFAGDHEAYYRMSDKNDLRFNSASTNPYGIIFHPDSTNPSRTGQGITVGTRYILSDSLPFRDVLFRVFDIANTSTVRYEKVFLGALCGTYVGITGSDNTPQEWNDDISIFYRSTNTILTRDFENDVSRNSSWVGPVGQFGESFIETPATPAIASYYGFTPSGSVRLGDDEWLWNAMKPGSFISPPMIMNDTVALGGGDVDYLYGSNYFGLDPGETRRLASVIAYGMTREEVEFNVLKATMLWNAKFDQNKVLKGIQLVNFDSHRLLRGTVTLEWSASIPGQTVSLWYRPDGRSAWQVIAASLPASGRYDWNTETCSDGAFGALRVILRDSAGSPLAFSESGQPFTVDNPVNGPPFVQIINNDLLGGASVSDTVYSLSLLIGDPEDSLLTVTGYYRTEPSGPWTQFDTYQSRPAAQPLRRQLNFSVLPNSDTFQMKFSVSDGHLLSTDFTGVFRKRTARTSTVQALVSHIAGPAEVPVAVHVLGPDMVRPDTYIITFDDTTSPGTTTFNVYDETTASYPLKNSLLLRSTETALFHGLSLYADEVTTTYDPSRTAWNGTPGPNRATSMVRANYPDLSLNGYAQPDDYDIAFDSIPLDTSVALPPDCPSIPICCRVTSKRTGAKIPVTVVTSPGFVELIFWEKPWGVLRPTWDVSMYFQSQDAVPTQGDTLHLVTRKAFSFLDTLRVVNIVGAVDGRQTIPLSYRLDQSYPNPFNPTARIRFTVPVSGMVEMQLFNLLGQRVMEIMRADVQAGTHEVQVDGSQLSSGVYIYRLKAGTFVQARKMILLK